MAIAKRLNVLLSEAELARIKDYSQKMSLSYSKTAVYIMKLGMAVVDIGLDPANAEMMIKTNKIIDQVFESDQNIETKHSVNGKPSNSKVRKLAK